MEQDHTQAWNRGIVGAQRLILCQAALTVGLLVLSGISMAGYTVASLVALPMSLLAISYLYTHVRVDRRIARAAVTIALLLGTMALSLVASFALARSPAPFIDVKLAAIDAAIGFDWVSYVVTVDSSFWVSQLLAAAYLSINVQPILIVLALTAIDRADRAAGLVLATCLTLLTTLAVFAFAPALSAFAHYAPMLPPLSNLRPVMTTGHIAIIEGVRSGALHILEPRHLLGLITIPSFHASAAILFAWSAWPLPRLRWPAASLNLSMLAATPVHGAHYLIDVIAGVLVALAAIAAAERWMSGSRRSSRGDRTAAALFPAFGLITEPASPPTRSTSPRTPTDRRSPR